MPVTVTSLLELSLSLLFDLTLIIVLVLKNKERSFLAAPCPCWSMSFVCSGFCFVYNPFFGCIVCRSLFLANILSSLRQNDCCQHVIVGFGLFFRFLPHRRKIMNVKIFGSVLPFHICRLDYSRKLESLFVSWLILFSLSICLSVCLYSLCEFVFVLPPLRQNKWKFTCRVYREILL